VINTDADTTMVRLLAAFLRPTNLQCHLRCLRCLFRVFVMSFYIMFLLRRDLCCCNTSVEYYLSSGIRTLTGLLFAAIYKITRQRYQDI